MQLHEKISGLTDQQSSASSALQQSIEQMQVTVKMRETERGIVEKENLLIWAVSMDYPELASFLISKGANPDITNSDGVSARFLANKSSPKMKSIFRRSV
jgi:hypothetical protein